MIALQAALVSALTEGAGLEALTGIHDGAPPRAAFPYAVLETGIATDWSTKTERGREHRLVVTIWDEGDRAARLHALMAAAETAIESLAVPGLVGLSFVRTRVARDPAGPWAGFVDYRARVIG